MKKAVLILLLASGCTTIHHSYHVREHECQYQHLTREEIAGLNTLAERRWISDEIVNALFEEDMRCGK